MLFGEHCRIRIPSPTFPSHPTFQFNILTNCPPKIRCHSSIDNSGSGTAMTQSDGITVAIIPCSSCKRNGEKCSFTRVPLKRGPSKRTKSDATPPPAATRQMLAIGAPIHHRTAAGSLANLHVTSHTNGKGASTNGNTVENVNSASQFRQRSMSDIGLSVSSNGLPGIFVRPYPPAADSTNSTVPGHHPRLPSIDALTANSISTMSTTTVTSRPPPSFNPATNGTPTSLSYFSKAPTGPPLINNMSSPSTTSISVGSSPHSPGRVAPALSDNGSLDSNPLILSPRSDSASLLKSSQSSNGSNALGFGVSNFRKFSAGGDITPEDVLAGWDDRCMDSYYQLVHPTLPVLPGSRAKLRARLMACSNSNIRSALLDSVSGLVSAHLSENSSVDFRAQVIAKLPILTSNLEVQNKILVLMCTLLYYLQTSESSWLGVSVGLAHDLMNDLETQQSNFKRRRLSVSGSPRSSISDTDENDEKIARRLFLLTVIVARLHAAVKHQPSMIPNDSVALDTIKDEECFDTGAFASRIGVQMVKLSMLCDSTSQSPEQLAKARHNLDILRTQIECLWDTSPILKALYYFVAVVHDQSVGGNDIQLLNDINVLTALIDSPLVSVSPLVSFFIPLLRSTLLRLNAKANNRGEVAQSAQKQLEMLDNLIIRRFPEFRKAQDRLQGLAAIAQLSEAVFKS